MTTTTPSKRPLLRAVGAAVTITAISAPAAFAAVGGGAVSGGGAGGSAATHFALYTEDDAYAVTDGDPNTNPRQGWGPDSINYFINMAQNNATFPVHHPERIQSSFTNACSDALQEATARSSDGKRPSRVVQVGVSYGKVDGKFSTFGAVNTDYQRWYNQYWADAAKSLKGYNAAQQRSVYEEFMQETREAGANVSVVCVALNEEEPKSPNYNLKITTDVATSFEMAGTTTPVNDMIHAAGGDGSTVKADVILTWDGAGKNKGKSVSKNIDLKTKGDTRSPNFTPADFGWSEWPAGKFWFDVKIDKQGKMAAAVDTPDRDPRETWDAKLNPSVEKELYVPGTTEALPSSAQLVAGQATDARIVANSNGYDEMTIVDTINTDQAFIGSNAADVKDAVYVLDPNGKKVPADIKIDRGTSGKIIVSAHVTGMTAPGDYTLVVPTYVLPNKKEYDLPDDSKVIIEGTTYNGNSKGTRKVIPHTDKAWVLDQDGALTTADPDHTNTVGADGQVFLPGSPVSAVVNGNVPAHMPSNLESLEITDDWTKAAQYVDFTDASKAKVYYNGADVTDQFTIKVEGTKTIATAKKSFLDKTKGLDKDGELKLVITGAFKSDYDTNGKNTVLHNDGTFALNNEGHQTNTPPVFTQTPKPDKVWALDENGALVANDPEWTNQEGADQKTFLQNDTVYASVNGKVPANLARALTKYVITDDWTDAATYVDFTDVSKAKVFFNGKDVTDQFDIKVEGTKTIATAKKSFLDQTKGLDKDGVTDLVIGGHFRDDYATHGDLVKLTNAGFEQWNDTERPTNVPPVFTWTPDPHKDVYGSLSEGGDQASIDGLGVFPGQMVEYNVELDVNIPDNTAHGDQPVKSFAVEDQYDPQFEPNRDSLEFYDTRTNRPIPRSNYTVKWNTDTHSFVVTFHDDWVAKNLKAGESGWLIMRFDGTVKDTAVGGTQVRNQAFEILNGAKTATEIPEVNIPNVEPHKEDLNTDKQDIDGKAVVEGDIILYRLTLDGGAPRSELAYDVRKLGLVDDYDENYLDLKAEGISVVDKETGDDVTSKFNVQVKDGKAYIFAKTIDTHNAWDEDIPGDPQPADLAVYAAQAVNARTSAIIDQALLGKDYYVYLPATVKKETDGYTILNTAWQSTNNFVQQTETVSNPLKDIDPEKDVVVSEADQDSLHGKEIALNSVFNYKLNSSTIPADRAYNAKDWSISDTFNAQMDHYNGIWAVYAETDIYDGETKVFSKGDLLADSAGHESETYAGLFTTEWDNETHTFTVTATEKFLALVNSRPDMPAAFSAYTSMTRIAPGEVTNVHREVYNGKERLSNEVKTRTPEHPSIDVEKWTLSEGEKRGDRDDAENPYTINGDTTEIAFTLTNTGDVPLTNLQAVDKTADGTTGEVGNITVKKNGQWIPLSDIHDLAVGETLTGRGTLKDVDKTHKDTITVTGESVYTHKTVSDADDWHGERITTPGDVIKRIPKDPGAVVKTAVYELGHNPFGYLTGLAAAVAAGVGFTAFRRNNKSDAKNTHKQ